MTLLQLKKLVAAYFETTPAAFVNPDTGVDALLQSINTSRMAAEQQHDFNYSKVTASLTFTAPASGQDIADASIPGGGTIKRVRNALVPIHNGDYLPVEFMLQDEWIKRQRRLVGRQSYDPSKTLTQYGFAVPNPVAYLEGSLLRVYPTLNSGDVVKMGIVKFYPDYTSDTDEDFFLQQGQQYLQWATILEVNKIARRFAPRQEGNIAEDALEDFTSKALAAFVQWDMGITENTSTPLTPQPSKK